MSGGEPRARLVCRSGALSGRTFDLGEETRIGRAPDNDLVLEAPSVSKRHAVIARREGGFVLEDLDSTYGTRLDGRPVTEPVRLDRMHVIEVSDVELVFTRLPAGGGAAAGDDADAGVGSPEAEDGEVDEGGAGSGDEAADEDRTVVERGGFGALPDLDDADTDDPGSATPSDPPDGPEEGRTVVDAGGFGALPDLEDGEADDDGEVRGDDRDERDRVAEGRGDAEPSGDAEGAREAGDDAGEPASAFELRVSYSPDRSVAFVLEPGDNVLGRSEECDITVDDPDLWLSRKHAVLRVKPEGVELVDLASVNGTFVGGERIERATLAPGSTFHLGPELELQLRKRS